MYYGNPKNRTIRDAQPCCCNCGKTLTTKEQVKVCYKNPRNYYNHLENVPSWSYHTQVDRWFYKCKWCGREQVVTIKITSKGV